MPMELGLLLDQHTEEGMERSHLIAVPIPYAEAIGSILWAAMVSRPDVMFSIGILTQFMHQPKKNTLEGAEMSHYLSAHHK